MAATSDVAAAGRPPRHLSSADLSSVMPGKSFTARVVDAFFSSVLPAALRAEGVVSSLHHCLVPPPGLLDELYEALLSPPRISIPTKPPALERWLKEHSPFSRQFLMLPLVASKHASLLIVCQLGALTAEGRSSDGSSRPCILHLDSLHFKGSGHQPKFHRLRSMLEHAARRSGVAADIKLTEDNLPAVPASVPQQRSADGSGACYMCTNALYFLANLPPAVDAGAVAQLVDYRVHLQDLFEGTSHCYPGFLTRDWYPNNVPESLRKRVLQGLVDLIQKQQPESVERDALLRRAQDVMAQLRAASKRPFDMPEKRRVKQQEEKEKRRLQAGMGNAGGQPAAEGMTAATAAAGASPRGVTAAATADGEGVRGGAVGAGTSGGDQHGRAALQLRPRSASRTSVVDERDGEEGHLSRSAPVSSALSDSSDSSDSGDAGSDYIPSEDSEDKSASEDSGAALRQARDATCGPVSGRTKRRASDALPHSAPSAKRRQRAGPAGPAAAAPAAGDVTVRAAFARQQIEAALPAVPLQGTLQAAAQQQLGSEAPCLRQAVPAKSGAQAAAPRLQQQQQQQQAQLLQKEQKPQRQHASEPEHGLVQLQPGSSGAHKARLQQVLASMAAAESAEEQHRPQLQRAAVRDALQLLGSKAEWKACLKCFSALLMEEQDVKFVALHEQLQDAEDAAAEVDRWVQEQLG